MSFTRFKEWSEFRYQDGSRYWGDVLETEEGTPYLVQPQVSLIASTQFHKHNLTPFLTSFPYKSGYSKYVDDTCNGNNGESLLSTMKFSGQICYMSLSEKRSKWSDREKYFANIVNSGHHSVLEHSQLTFLIWGVSRSLTHELVRSRVGTSFSQVSQRYTDDTTLRFVCRPEFLFDDYLRNKFEERIDRTFAEYKELMQELKETEVSGTGTDKRKKVQQAARALLGNEVEAPIVVTMNLRSLRHFLEIRMSEHADLEISTLAAMLFCGVNQVVPEVLFDLLPQYSNLVICRDRKRLGIPPPDEVLDLDTWTGDW